MKMVTGIHHFSSVIGRFVDMGNKIMVDSDGKLLVWNHTDDSQQVLAEHCPFSYCEHTPLKVDITFSNSECNDPAGCACGDCYNLADSETCFRVLNSDRAEGTYHLYYRPAFVGLPSEALWDTCGRISGNFGTLQIWNNCSYPDFCSGEPDYEGIIDEAEIKLFRFIDNYLYISFRGYSGGHEVSFMGVDDGGCWYQTCEPGVCTDCWAISNDPENDCYLDSCVYDSWCSLNTDWWRGCCGGDGCAGLAAWGRVDVTTSEGTF